MLRGTYSVYFVSQQMEMHVNIKFGKMKQNAISAVKTTEIASITNLSMVPLASIFKFFTTKQSDGQH